MLADGPSSPACLQTSPRSPWSTVCGRPRRSAQQSSTEKIVDEWTAPHWATVSTRPLPDPDHADRAGFLGEQLPGHRLDDAVGLFDAAAGAQQVAHLAEQGDLAPPLLELGDPPGQAPVRFLQRRLGLLALGDVLEHRDGEARLSLLVADHRGGERHPDRAAVAPDDAMLGAAVLDPAFGQLAPDARRLLALFLVDEVGDDAAAQLLELIAEHLDEGAVGVGDPTGRVEADDADQRRFEDGAEAILALDQRLLGAAALGDVAEVDDDGGHFGVGQAVDPDGLEMAELAVAVQAAIAGAERDPGLAQDVGEEPAGVVAVVGMQVVEEVPAGELAPVEAEEPLDRRARVADVAVRAHQVQAVGAMLDEQPETGLAFSREFDRAGVGMRFHRPCPLCASRARNP